MTTETTPTPSAIEATERLLQILDAHVPDDLKDAYPELRRRITMSVQGFASISNDGIEKMPGDVAGLTEVLLHVKERLDLSREIFKSITDAARGSDEDWAAIRAGILSSPFGTQPGVQTH